MELGRTAFRMATETHKRILVHLRKSSSQSEAPIAARFTQSILDYFGCHDNEGQVTAKLDNNRLIISDDFRKNRPIKIRRPPFCPIHNLTTEDIDRLPDDILNRGIDVGAAVLLHTGDNKILLTRRASHLRTFPGIWVPPGGHIEENESFIEAGLRELKEETGLLISQADCHNGQMSVLALWESTFPTLLSLGQPKRHHVVVYLGASLLPTLTSDRLQQQLHLEPDEVGAALWLDSRMIKAIVSTEEDPRRTSGSGPTLPVGIPKEIEGLLVTKDKHQEIARFSTAPLLQTTASDHLDIERVSTGTKFALEEWLKVT